MKSRLLVVDLFGCWVYKLNNSQPTNPHKLHLIVSQALCERLFIRIFVC